VPEINCGVSDQLLEHYLRNLSTVATDYTHWSHSPHTLLFVGWLHEIFTVRQICATCPLTVKTILIECSDFRDIRNKYFVASTMKDVFEQVSKRNAINFITETYF